jgi:hypothetical protein
MTEQRLPDTPTPAFGESYDNARKAYSLASALLLAWGMLGVEILEPSLELFRIKLNSPKAAPYVLIALVAYFAFRLTVEWYQAESNRRDRFESKVDFAVAHMIGAAAILLYEVQTLLGGPTADRTQQLSIAFDFVAGFAFAEIGIVMTPPGRTWLTRWHRNMVPVWAVIMVIVGVIVVLIVLVVTGAAVPVHAYVFGGGLLTCLGLALILRRFAIGARRA